MWYKISCWKPENNSQLLFSALHLQSSSALGSWRVLAFGQKAPRPYPGAGEAWEEASVKADITRWLLSRCIQQVTLPPGKAIRCISQQRPQKPVADRQRSVARQFSHRDQSWGAMGEAGLSLRSARGSTVDQASSKPGSGPWRFTPLGWHPKCLKPWYHTVAWLHCP